MISIENNINPTVGEEIGISTHCWILKRIITVYVTPVEILSRTILDPDTDNYGPAGITFLARDGIVWRVFDCGFRVVMHPEIWLATATAKEIIPFMLGVGYAWTIGSELPDNEQHDMSNTLSILRRHKVGVKDQDEQDSHQIVAEFRGGLSERMRAHQEEHFAREGNDLSMNKDSHNVKQGV